MFRGRDGSTWEELDSLRKVPEAKDWHSPWGPADLNSVVFEGQRIYVGIEVGSVVSSDDNGATWRTCGKGVYEDVHALALDMRRRSTIFANTAAGPYRSDDGGASWRMIGKGLKDPYSTAITIPTRRQDLLFIATMRGPYGGGSAVYVSENRGESWQPLDLGRSGSKGGINRKAMCAHADTLYLGLTDGSVLLADLDELRFRRVVEGLPLVNGVASLEGRA